MVGVIIALSVLLNVWVWTSSAEEKPRYGGILIYAVRGDPPSYDAHQESSVDTVHRTSPHYNLLVKFDPEHYPNIVGDLAESWAISKDKKTYTFKIHKDVRFHDGSNMTAKDIKASFDHIIFPPPGILSVRKGMYLPVEKIETPNDYTVVFRLKWPSAAFLGSLAAPYNHIYKADILSRDPHWYEKNIMGTGPFRFVEHVVGSHWVGKRNEDYFIKGRPYLDGFRAISIKDTSARALAIRGGRAHIDFRQFPPNIRDDMVRTMGDKCQVQEIPFIASIIVVPNSKKKPFDDPRVRRALSLALDRWSGAEVLFKISEMRWPGGLLRPGSKDAMTESELTQVPGFSKDIKASQKEARRLLREAGVPEGFKFKLLNRPVLDIFGPAGIWVIDQWRQIGLNVEQEVKELGAYYDTVRKTGDFEVAIVAQDDFVDEPTNQLFRFISYDKSAVASGGFYIDRVLDGLYFNQDQVTDPIERRKLIRQFEMRVLGEMAYQFPILWLHRIVPYSAKVRGWTALPSNQMNVGLDNVWLSED
jgi:peptide/nickel transport system substrate-binding protein